MERRRSPVEPVDIQPTLHCSVEDQRRLLAASAFFSALTDEQVNEVQRQFRQHHFEPGETIQLAGDPAQRLSVVARGVVKLVRPTLDGQDVLLDFLGPGEHFGSLAELGDAIYQEEVTAQTASCVLYTTAGAFQELLRQYPAVALASLQIVADRLRDAHSAIEYLSAYPVEQRVAATLVHLAAKAGKPHEQGVLIEMPLSRQDIADITGAKVETVSRILSDFRRRALIDSGRQWISILDHETLSAIAGTSTGKT